MAQVLDEIEPGWASDPLLAHFLSSDLTVDLVDLDRLSSTLFDLGERLDGPDALVLGGFERVLAPLACGLDIRLRHPVDRVQLRSDRVVVHVGAQRYECSRVVLAVPLGVLAAEVIRSEPELPVSHRRAIASIGFSAVERFCFVWDEAFWDDTEFLAYNSRRPDLFGFFLNLAAVVEGAPALMTFAFADEARAAQLQSDQQMIELAADQLRLMYGPTVPRPRAMRRSRWVTDPFMRGAYSFPTVTTKEGEFAALARPVGRLHLAGEHTQADHFSRVHGAYLSGRRAAEEILANST